MSKFNENLSGGSQVIPCGWTDRQTDMMKLVIARHSFVNAPKSALREVIILQYQGQEQNEISISV
jgi:hypothetical protein